MLISASPSAPSIITPSRFPQHAFLFPFWPQYINLHDLASLIASAKKTFLTPKSQEKMGLEISEDQFRPITPVRVVIPIPRALNNTKEEEEEEAAAAEELLHLEHEEECHTPKSPAAHVMAKQPPLVCLPLPKKPRQAARRNFRRLWLFQVPDDLESLFMVITGTKTSAKKIRTS
ncbi:hypothetical protein D8674_034525 [Pyrus ussuriensis x Pyrus communis]|uniref:Uncharacterized protein n=1 Tax=Pyrus ussuriensis x Pyrus communis TaxID=2448454 RepID=A0A5N5HW80_9ROSA|nr:hypothetical protein D8674_034525 [Pyrus ussuriensis x Pyrus communis]